VKGFAHIPLAVDFFSLGGEPQVLIFLSIFIIANQNSTQRVFNPEKLVESLQLRITEQQDAQE
jgi:hypothetical protein